MDANGPRRLTPPRVLAVFLFFAVLACPALPSVLVGQVSDDVQDTPIANATVTVVELGLDATTGTDGVYTFSALPPGTYTVRVSAQGYDGASRLVTTLPGETTTADFLLTVSVGEGEGEGELPGVLTGVVSDAADAAPIAGATVLIVELGLDTTTDTEGVYLFGSLMPDSYTVRAFAEGYDWNTQLVDVTEGETTTLNLVLTTDDHRTNDGCAGAASGPTVKSRAGHASGILVFTVLAALLLLSGSRNRTSRS